ncbi:MAG: sulfatase [Luteolibacter sp.]
MSAKSSRSPLTPSAGLLPVVCGVSLFLLFQYGIALWRLTHTSANMANKFSALAKEKYIDFLIGQNALMLVAYAILAIVGTFLLQPVLSFIDAKFQKRSSLRVAVMALIGVAIMHFFCVLRLVETRPYFLNDAEFGYWYYKIFDIIPTGVKPVFNTVFFQMLPAVFIGKAIFWQIRRFGKTGRALASGIVVIGLAGYGIYRYQNRPRPVAGNGEKPLNVLIIGSDSLRGDKLGCAGYKPQRSDGLAAAGVSPTIDSLAARSARFENCYTTIASTLESGTQLMSSMYPQTHGIRQMYPDQATVVATQSKIVPMPRLLNAKGYDTAAIGDWCAGYYEVMPMDMQHLSVSSFDNFKVYMSQAVVMAHFVVPLYFDNPLGYKIFPQISAFAQFVTPQVVTRRVENRLSAIAAEQKPFFWHVFFSCNHLPYRSQEPYNTLFTDPGYQGENRNGVESFDIDSFIGSTDLESKWKALPQHEIQQIRSLYDGCTREFDHCVSRILESLKKNGLDDHTIVIITADHGDDQYEPGVTLGHGLTFNGGLQANHVPMIVYVPGAKPAVFPENVRLIDVMPTLADLLGVEKPAVWQGQSFAGWIKGDTQPIARPLYAETGFPFIQFTVPGVTRPKLPAMDELTHIDETFNYQFVVKDEYTQAIIRAKQRCLRTRDWKLVCTPTAGGTRHYSLFHLSTDKDGENDLAATRPEVLQPMIAALETWMDRQIETPISGIFPNGEPQ